jgi:RNase adapter protein RapZ
MTPRRVVLVTGLSGAGRTSILRILEDLGYEAVDNPPITLIEELVSRGDRPAAVGIDARSRGFDARAVLATLERLRVNAALRPELVFAAADEVALLRRYTETRRRHPMAPSGRVVEGIREESELTAPLREAADLVLDTSGTSLPALRRLVEARFAADEVGLTLTLTSFAYPAGLPPEADLVFDARFLRNPHYDPNLRPKTGTDPDVAAYVEADPDFPAFFAQIETMLQLLLPRFVQEGKKYVTVAIGCTGGRHRSVHIVEKLAARLRAPGGLDMRGGRITVAHRELQKAAAAPAHPPATLQAQEA